MKIYRTQREAFLKANPRCAVYPWRSSEDIHHMKGRGKLLLDQEYWLAVSRAGHRQIHDQPLWALKMGYSMIRHGTLR